MFTYLLYLTYVVPARSGRSCRVAISENLDMNYLWNISTCWQVWLCKLSEAGRWRSSQGLPRVLPRFPEGGTEMAVRQGQRFDLQNSTPDVNRTSLTMSTSTECPPNLLKPWSDDTYQWDLFPSQSRSQPAIDSLETVLSSEGDVYCEETSGGRSKSHTGKQSGHKRRRSPFLSSLGSPLPFFFLAPSCSSRESSLSCSSPEQFMKSFHGWKDNTGTKSSFWNFTHARKQTDSILWSHLIETRLCWHFELERKEWKTTNLYVVFIGAGLSEDGRDGWITANFQIIFGTLIPLKKISKVARWLSEKRHFTEFPT